MTSVKTRVVIIAARCIVTQNLCITGIWNNKIERERQTHDYISACISSVQNAADVVCFFQIMLFSEYILCSLDSVYIEQAMIGELKLVTSDAVLSYVRG